jgi:hypothetical protein
MTNAPQFDILADHPIWIASPRSPPPSWSPASSCTSLPRTARGQGCDRMGDLARIGCDFRSLNRSLIC